MPARTRWRWRSSPVTSGMWRSITRHSGAAAWTDFRKSRAEQKVVISKEEAESSRASALRTDASSSTSATRVPLAMHPLSGGLPPASSWPKGQFHQKSSSGRSQTGALGQAYQLGDAAYFQFGHHPPAVNLDRLLDGAER